MTLPIDLVLVRHGQSEGNKAKRRSEQGDHSAFTTEFRRRHTSTHRLTPLGRQQAERAGHWLRAEFFKASVGFDRYLVSEYVRAMETAGLLALPGATWFADYNLSERDWGIDSLPEDERQQAFEEALVRRDHEPFFWAPPNGESFARLCGRLRAPLDTLHRECSDKRVLMVCHGGVMWGFRVLIERMSQARFRELYLSRASEDQVWNCQIIHYTRRDPESGRLSKYAGWMRMVRPHESPIWTTGWQRIERPRDTNEDLLALADRVPPMVE